MYKHHQIFGTKNSEQRYVQFIGEISPKPQSFDPVRAFGKKKDGTTNLYKQDITNVMKILHIEQPLPSDAFNRNGTLNSL